MTWRHRLKRLEQATAAAAPVNDWEAWRERMDLLLSDPVACGLAADQAVAYSRARDAADPELRATTERLEARLAALEEGSR